MDKKVKENYFLFFIDVLIRHRKIKLLISIENQMVSILFSVKDNNEVEQSVRVRI